jgi:starvation-inducible DNA-binding protein
MKVYLVALGLVLLAAAPSAQARTHRLAKKVSAVAPAQSLLQGSATPSNTPTPATEPNGQFDYRNPVADALISIEADKRQPFPNDLQATVVELLELFHNLKQSHWNLRGPLCLPLHEKLQKNADEYRKYADPQAERVLQVGNPTTNRTCIIAATANLGGYLSDKKVLLLMTERIATVAKRGRQYADQLNKVY